MRYLIMILSMYSSLAIAEQVEFDSQWTRTVLTSGAPRCFNSALLQMQIVAKVDENTYETASVVSGQLVSRGVLNTKWTSYDQKGRIALMVKYMGATDIKTSTGFMAKFGVWEECK